MQQAMVQKNMSHQRSVLRYMSGEQQEESKAGQGGQSGFYAENDYNPKAEGFDWRCRQQTYYSPAYRPVLRRQQQPGPRRC